MQMKYLTVLLMTVTWTANAANLSEVYKLARQHDPIYAAAYASYKAGLEKLPQSQALLRPVIGMSANLRHNESKSSVSSIGTNSYNSYGWGLSLQQPLYDKQNLETFEQGKLQAILAELQLKVAEQDLIIRVAKAYFDVLQAQDNLATSEAQKKAIAEQLAQAKFSFEVGAATITDTHEAQARYDLAMAQDIAARNDLDVKRQFLEKLVGVSVPKLAVLVKDAKLPDPVPNDMNKWVAQSQESGLSVALGRTVEEISRREIAKQRAGNLPTVDLVASYADNRNGMAGSLSDVNSKSALLGIELNWALYQGGALESRVREAQANQEKARFDLDNAVQLSALDARNAFLGVSSGNARVKALNQAVVSSESQLQSTKLGQEVGVRTRVDVLNAQQQLFAAQRDLAAARYETVKSGLALRAAAASLSEADLAALDSIIKELK
jgi:outer membrane protein